MRIFVIEIKGRKYVLFCKYILAVCGKWVGLESIMCTNIFLFYIATNQTPAILIGIIQSCIKRNDRSDKELKVHNETINKSESEFVNKSRTCDSTNLGRISRRISVRVVPIQKTIQSIEDVSFLEVYGIFPVKTKRFTLLNGKSLILILS